MAFRLYSGSFALVLGLFGLLSIRDWSASFSAFSSWSLTTFHRSSLKLILRSSGSVLCLYISSVIKKLVVSVFYEAVTLVTWLNTKLSTPSWGNVFRSKRDFVSKQRHMVCLWPCKHGYLALGKDVRFSSIYCLARVNSSFVGCRLNFWVVRALELRLLYSLWIDLRLAKNFWWSSSVLLWSAFHFWRRSFAAFDS